MQIGTYRNEKRLMRHGDGMQAVGNGEHHMEVLYSGKHLLLTHLYPYLPFLVLALRTVSGTAAVIADMNFATLRTDLYMTAKDSRSADGHGCK
jgi:hypothetical protein